MQLLDVYGKDVRSNLEMTVPVWHGELTHKQNKAIERVQKLAFEIILNHSYKSYNNALKTLDQETPYQSRTFKVNNFLCLKNILIIQTLVQNLRLQRNSNANQIHKTKCAILPKHLNTMQALLSHLFLLSVFIVTCGSWGQRPANCSESLLCTVLSHLYSVSK